MNEQTVYFEQKGEKTLLLRSFLNLQEAGNDDNISVAVANSSANPVVASFTVIGRNPKTKAQLIDITDFFKQDNSITSFSSNAKTQMKIGAIATDRSEYLYGAFAQNTYAKTPLRPSRGLFRYPIHQV